MTFRRDNSMLAGRIMRRVYILYTLRTVFSPALVKCYILLALIWQVSTIVSVPSVLENAPRGSVLETGSFFVRALGNTELTVQLVLLGTALVGAWLGWGLVGKVLRVRKLAA